MTAPADRIDALDRLLVGLLVAALRARTQPTLARAPIQTPFVVTLDGVEAEPLVPERP